MIGFLAQAGPLSYFTTCGSRRRSFCGSLLGGSLRRGERTVADRVEQFAIEAKLGGRPNIGTISTTVVPTEKGRWNVKVYYLSPSAKRGWRSVSEDDWEAGDDWKEP